MLPPKLVDRFNNLKHVSEDHGSLLDHATLASFMESGAFYTQLRRCRRAAYAERRESFLDAVARCDLPFSFPNTDGGMNLAALIPAHWNDKMLSEQLRFGFTAFDPRAIAHGVERVASVISTRSDRS